MWASGISEGLHVLIRNVLARLVPDKQQQWYKGVCFLCCTRMLWWATCSYVYMPTNLLNTSLQQLCTLMHGKVKVPQICIMMSHFRFTICYWVEFAHFTYTFNLCLFYVVFSLVSCHIWCESWSMWNYGVFCTVQLALDWRVAFLG